MTPNKSDSGDELDALVMLELRDVARRAQIDYVAVNHPNGTRHGQGSNLFGDLLKVNHERIMQAVAAHIQAVVEEKEIKVFDRWLSIPMGAVVRFEPCGMWMQRVWENGGMYVCSGIKRNADSTSITDHDDYRFTKIGDSSVDDVYVDVFLKGADIKRWFDDGKKEDIKTVGGWFTIDRQRLTQYLGKEEDNETI